jgi:citronellol/citronellal dehydrogenase
MSVLDGKVAIVTGTSRGSGAEIARRFGAAGAAVAVAARTADPGRITWSEG